MAYNEWGETPLTRTEQTAFQRLYEEKARQVTSSYKVGDKVKVLRKPTIHELNVLADILPGWVSSMDNSLGRVLIIREIGRNCVRLSDGFSYPVHVLKKEEVNTTTSIDETLSQIKSDPTAKEFVESFEIDKLAEECNIIFQAILEDSKNNLDQQIKEATDNFSNSISLASEEHIKMFLKEIERGRTIINMPDTSEIPIRVMDHPKMKDIVKSLAIHKKTMLVGPAGTGKTYMVAQLADRMKLPFYKYSCSRDSSVHDLLGYKQPASETYLETVFLKAYENGGIFLVDEYDAMSGDMSLFFNGIADGSKFISVPHRDTKPIAEKHKDFYLVMCGNTWGKGSHEFTGRDFQDNALMDRFRVCRHFVNYHFELEKELAGNYYPILKRMRTVLEEKGSYLSTRNIEDISICIRSGIDINDIVEMISEDLIEADKKPFKESLQDSIASYRRNFTAP